MKGIAFVIVIAIATPGAAGPASASSGVVPGHYVCRTLYGRPMPAEWALAFDIRAGGRYEDAGGDTGTYRLLNGTITFSGGALAGWRGHYRTVPRPPANDPPPTISLFGGPQRVGEMEVCGLRR